MGKLNEKQCRALSFALERLFKPKSILPIDSFEDYKNVENLLSRQLHLTRDRVLLMSDQGLEYFRSIIKTIHESKFFDDLAEYSDVANGCRKVFESLISENQMPESVDELLELVRREVDLHIDHWTFAVPIYGVELIDIDALPLGAMRLARTGVEHLDAAGVRHDFTDVQRSIKISKTELWLIGSAHGTQRVAEALFRIQAELAVGMLAISAGSMYQNGATAFRIGVVMSPEQAHGGAVWYSWRESVRDLITHYTFKKSQNFQIDARLVEQFDEAAVFQKAFLVLQKDSPSQLEDAFARAVYWYSEAHREAIPTMKLVKYWSCVETFFSAENKDIARAVSSGLASILVFGGFGFVEPSSYEEIKKKVAKHYNLRSRALHGALHQHVSAKDAAELSQWVAWMLVNMVTLFDRGYLNVSQIKEQCDRLDRLATMKEETPRSF